MNNRYMYLVSLGFLSVLQFEVSAMERAELKGSGEHREDLLKFVSAVKSGKINLNAPKDAFGRTLLMKFAQDGNELGVQYLIDFGADLNIQDKLGYTALILAARFGHKNTVELLTQNKADLNLKTKSGLSAYDWAIKGGNDDIADLLKKCSSSTGCPLAIGKKSWKDTDISSIFEKLTETISQKEEPVSSGQAFGEEYGSMAEEVSEDDDDIYKS